MFTFILIVLWIVCGVLGYGLLFAALQGAFPRIAVMEYKNDRRFSLMFSIFGPFCLMAVILHLFAENENFKHGLKFK